MKKVSVPLNTFFILMGLMMSSVSIAAAPEASAEKEQFRLARMSAWLHATYGMPKHDWGLVKEWLVKKWRGEEIEPELDKQAKSIFKKYIIPAVVIAALIGGLVCGGVKRE